MSNKQTNNRFDGSNQSRYECMPSGACDDTPSQPQPTHDPASSKQVSAPNLMVAVEERKTRPGWVLLAAAGCRFAQPLCRPGLQPGRDLTTGAGRTLDQSWMHGGRVGYFADTAQVMA